jgi:hypothetical protein
MRQKMVLIFGVRAVPFYKKGNVIKWFGTCTDIQNIKETGIELLKAKEHAEESDQNLLF